MIKEVGFNDFGSRTSDRELLILACEESFSFFSRNPTASMEHSRQSVEQGGPLLGASSDIFICLERSFSKR